MRSAAEAGFVTQSPGVWGGSMNDSMTAAQQRSRGSRFRSTGTYAHQTGHGIAPRVGVGGGCAEASKGPYFLSETDTPVLRETLLLKTTITTIADGSASHDRQWQDKQKAVIAH